MSSGLNVTNIPRVSSSIQPSPFRPPVLAAERLSTWKTPFSLCHEQSLLQRFGKSDVVKLKYVALNALAPSTRSTYGAGLLRFNQYCDSHQISEDDRMPASTELLSLFFADAAGRVSLECAKNWLAGIRFWHGLYDARWNGDSILVASTLKGLKNLETQANHRPQRAPVTLDHIYALRNSLSSSNSRDVAILAMAEMSFWGICRLGETTISSLRNFNKSFHATRTAPITRGVSRDGISFLKVHIPWSKTTASAGADIVLFDHDDYSNPFRSLLRHLHVNRSVPHDAPLFAYETRDGWDAITRSDFLQTCNTIWKSTGLPETSGHSFRIGGTTELLIRNVPPEVVASLGRWNSSGFLRYWRKIEEIMPSYISKSFTAEDFSRLSDSVAKLV